MLRIAAYQKGELRTHYQRPAYVPQKSELDAQYPVTLRQVVEMGFKPASIFHRFFKPQVAALQKNIVESCLQEVGLPGSGNLLFREASGGQLQRALIARALTINPDFMILDEPFSNIDSHGKKEIAALLQKIHQKKQTTLCVIDHHVGHDHVMFTHCIELEDKKVKIHDYSDHVPAAT